MTNELYGVSAKLLPGKTGRLDAEWELISERKPDLLVVLGDLNVGAMIGGNAAVSRDVPPRVILAERNLVCGLNLVGLRRLKIPKETIAELKKCYAAVYQELTNPGKLAAAALASGLGQAKEARSFLEFFQKNGRRFCRPKS